MADSERLGTRLEQEARRRAARDRANAPRPLGADAPRIVAEWARSKMVDPTRFRYATDDEFDRRDEEIRREMIQRKAEIALSRLPERYRDAEIPRTPAGYIAQRWVDGYRNGVRKPLTILGDPGTGKTYMAAAIARALLLGDRPVPVAWTTVPDMLDTLKDSRAGLPVDMQMFKTYPVLVLDDLGTEYQTGWTNTQLFTIAHARSHNARPTIVTSNMTGPTLRQHYDIRLLERLSGGGELIMLTGDTRRTMPF